MEDQSNETITAPDAQQEQETPAGVREHNKSLVSENKDLRQRVMGTDLSAIGLDAGSGLGLAIVESYGGRYEPGSVAEYAKEKYAYSPGGEEESSPVAQQIEQTQEVVSNLQDASTPARPATAMDELAAREQRLTEDDAGRKDAESSLRLKSQLYRRNQRR